MSDPYRTQGHVETVEQRRLRLYDVLQGMLACDVSRWPSDQRVAYERRLAEVREALFALR